MKGGSMAPGMNESTWAPGSRCLYAPGRKLLNMSTTP